MPSGALPEWERLIACAAHLQELLPSAVLVGGTAAALHAKHRYSHDADHILTDLPQRFDEILAQLESVAGWQTARIKRPVMILGSLDGIETGVRQLIRKKPLDTTEIQHRDLSIKIPTIAEMLRIKGVLILKRNATRDYLDFVALADRQGDRSTKNALRDFDELYPQPNKASALQQLQIQLAKPMPYDLDATRLDEYRDIDPKWREWTNVEKEALRIAEWIMEMI